MTTYVHRFMVVPDAHVATAREIATTLADPGAADGMWDSGLSADGSLPATHWVSTGMIDAAFAGLLGDAPTTFYAYQQAGGTKLALADVQALYDATPIGSFIRDDAQDREFVCLADIGLRLVMGVGV